VYLHFDKVQGAKVADLNCKTEVSLSIGSNGVTNGRRTLWHSQSNFHASHFRTSPRSRSIFDQLRDFQLEPLFAITESDTDLSRHDECNRSPARNRCFADFALSSRDSYRVRLRKPFLFWKPLLHWPQSAASQSAIIIVAGSYRFYDARTRYTFYILISCVRENVSFIVDSKNSPNAIRIVKRLR